LQWWPTQRPPLRSSRGGVARGVVDGEVEVDVDLEDVIFVPFDKEKPGKKDAFGDSFNPMKDIKGMTKVRKAQAETPTVAKAERSSMSIDADLLTGLGMLADAPNKKEELSLGLGEKTASGKKATEGEEVARGQRQHEAQETRGEPESHRLVEKE